MKKFLFWVFSIVLTASTANAQLLLKKGAAQNVGYKTTVQQQDNKGFKAPTARTIKGFGATSFSVSAPTVKAQKPELLPAGEGTNAPTIYGSVIYADSWTSGAYGLYTVPTTNEGSFTSVAAGPNASFGGVLVENTYYYMYQQNILGIFVVNYCEGIDIETKQVVYEASPSTGNFAPAGLAVNPLDDKVYGIFLDETGSAFRLGTIEFATNGPVTTEIAALSGSWRSFAINKEGVAYAIDVDGDLYKMDLTDGSTTLVGSTGAVSQYLSGACIDPASGRMFWAVSDDLGGYLYEINTTTGEGTLLTQFADGEEVTGMYIPAPAAAPKAPAAVTNLSASFPEGKLTGSLTFTVPTTLYDGTPATGNVKYKVTANGDLVDLASVSYGETVTISPVTVYETGMINFVVVLTNEAGDSPKAKCQYFVGNGVPSTPKNVKAEYDGTKMNITWSAVTTSADGGYVNPDEVTYTVVGMPANQEIATNIKGLSATNVFSAPEKATAYYYLVTANFADGSSVAGVSNTVVLGNIIPPYTNDFTTEGDAAYWHVFDTNADNKTWTYWPSEHAMRVAYNSSKPMDDWLITYPVKLEANAAYYVSFDARNQGTSYAEKVEMLYGNACDPEAMTNSLVPATTLSDGVYHTLGGWIVSDKAQTIYIGIHGISDRDKYFLYVTNFNIGEGVSAKRPGEATNFVVTPGTSVLNAKVAFNAPTVDMLGAPVETLTKVDVLRGDLVVKTFEAPAAGAALSFLDENVPAGNNTYTVKAYNVHGEGLPVSTTVYVGFAAPEDPANIIQQETATLGTVLVSWDAVAETVLGQPLSVNDVTYTLAYVDGDYVGDEIVSGFNITAAEVVYQSPTAPQDFAQFALKAKTNGGESAWLSTGLTPVGPAYHNFALNFTNGTLDGYILGIRSLYGSNNSASIYGDGDLGLTSVTGDGGFMGTSTNGLDDSEAVFSGKISLEGLEQPALTFYTYNIAGDDPNTISVNVCEINKPWTEVLAATPVMSYGEEGWNKVTVPLTQYAGKEIQFEVVATCKNYVYTLFDDFKVADLLSYDLAAQEISAPAKVEPGQKYNVVVNVSNEGAKAAENFTIELYKKGEVASTLKVEKLDAFANANYSFEQEMPAIAVNPVDYKAVVAFDADENVENNETELIVVEPVVSHLPAVQNLIGEGAQHGNILRWSEPDLNVAAEGTTYDFEDGTSWAHEYDGWTFVDADGAEVGGFQGSNIPGITPGSTTASFFVFDSSDSQFNQTFAAHSGTKYLASLFRYDDGTVSDWAISPELAGSAQTISFWARSYSAQYPEAFEVLYSTTGIETSDFTVLEGSMVDPVSAEWTEYSYDLPEGAKYFAIHSVATGSFMFMVDDVTYTAAGQTSELSILGYNVYRDGVKLNTELVTECEYLDTDVTLGITYEYAVVPVFDRGEGKPALVGVTSGVADVEAGIVITTADKNIVVLGAEGLEVTVSAVDGKVLYAAEGTAKTVVPATNGVYIVKAGNKVAKVIVK